MKNSLTQETSVMPSLVEALHADAPALRRWVSWMECALVLADPERARQLERADASGDQWLFVRRSIQAAESTVLEVTWIRWDARALDALRARLANEFPFASAAAASAGHPHVDEPNVISEASCQGLCTLLNVDSSDPLGQAALVAAMLAQASTHGRPALLGALVLTASVLHRSGFDLDQAIALAARGCNVAKSPGQSRHDPSEPRAPSWRELKSKVDAAAQVVSNQIRAQVAARVMIGRDLGPLPAFLSWLHSRVVPTLAELCDIADDMGVRAEDAVRSARALGWRLRKVSAGHDPVAVPTWPWRRGQAVLQASRSY